MYLLLGQTWLVLIHSQVLERFTLTGESMCNCPAKINCMRLKGSPHLRPVRRLLASRCNLHDANPSPSGCWNKAFSWICCFVVLFQLVEPVRSCLKDGKTTLISKQCTGSQSLLPNQRSLACKNAFHCLHNFPSPCIMKISNYMAMYGSFLHCFHCITKISG